jgi:hypothetical protein
MGRESQDIVRRHRIGWLFLFYWILTMVARVLLPSGDQLGVIRDAAHALVAPLSGVTQVATKSFDQGFVEVFIAFALLTATVLALAGCFWVPRGSEKVFPDARSRWGIVFAAILLLTLAIGLLFKGYPSQEAGGGRTAAFLNFGSSSRIGVLTILNAWFGFAQLFMFMALRAGITTSTR